MTGFGGVAIFNRNSDGTLEQLPGAAGCISQDGGGCHPGIGLNVARSVTTSPDGRNVYVASALSLAVAIFNRNSDGTLEQLDGEAGCISQGGVGGCRPGIGLDSPSGISLSPDGESAYVSSAGSGTVAIFDRNPDGTLEQPPGAAGCISQGGDLRCQQGIGLIGVTSVATSPDGKNVYVASERSDAVAIFSRDPDGTLEQLPGAAGCISQDGGGCQPGIGLIGAASVITSPDGKNVYVASEISDAVAIFSRDPDGTLEQLPGAAGCISQDGGGCRPGNGLDRARSVTTSPDGMNVYVAAADSDALAIFHRNSDGSLEQLPGAAGCISQDGSGGCQGGIGLDGARGVATSPDGKSVYVAAGLGEGADGVAIFDRAVPAPPDTLAPVVSGFRVAPKRFKAAPKGRSSFRFRLSESATVEIAVDRVRPGRKVGKRCKKPTPKLAKRPRCKRFIGVGRTLRFKGRSAGANKIAFNGKASGRALKPGLYRASIIAKDAAGSSSAPKRTRFTVLKPRQ